MDTVELPVAFGSGASSSERLTEVPPGKILVLGNTAGLEELTISESAAGSVSWSFTVKGTSMDVPVMIVWSAIAEITGGSFVPGTVRTKESEAVRPSLSRTVTVIAAEPVRLSVGTMRIQRLVPAPPSSMLDCGTNIRSDEFAERLNALEGVSRSLTWKNSGPRTVSSLICWSGMSEIVGPSFTELTSRTKVAVELAPFVSVAVTVIDAAPDASGAGSMCSEWPGPVPVTSTIGVKPGLADDAETEIVSADDSASDTVKTMSIGVSSSVV